MADGRESHRLTRRDRRWWSGVAIGAALLVAGGIVIAYVIADRSSPVSRRSTPRPSTTTQSSVPESSVPQSSAPQSSVPPSS